MSLGSGGSAGFIGSGIDRVVCRSNACDASVVSLGEFAGLRHVMLRHLLPARVAALGVNARKLPGGAGSSSPSSLDDSSLEALTRTPRS